MIAVGLRLSMVVLGLAFNLLAGCAKLDPEMGAQLDNTIETMMEALRARDDGAILSLAANPQDFGENGRLEHDVAGFLYDGDFIRGYNPDARSVVEIMALGRLLIRIVREKSGPTAVISSPKLPDEKARVLMIDTGGRVTVLFIPERFEEEAQVVSFYSERWMRDYFACEFHLIDGRWVLLYNICFAESGGPYPEPYGMWHVPGSAPRELARLDLEPRRGPQPRI